MKYEDNEIYKTIGNWRKFHKFIVKPFSYFFSSLILRRSLLKAIGEVKGKKVIDVSCGDDKLAVKLMREGAKVTCNDLCIESMKPIMKYKMKFTNKNLLDLTGDYDVVVFKNTFHHLKNITQIRNCLKVLKRLGKKVVIMDIDDPRKFWLAKIWNTYYRKVLKDQGNFFIGYDNFKFHVMDGFKKNKISFKRILTIKGFYMLAVIEEND